MSIRPCKPLLCVLLLVALVSCTVPESETLSEALPPAAAEVLNPGDMIGAMEITTAEFWDTDKDLYSLCIEGNAENEALYADDTVNTAELACELPAGSQLIVNCAGVAGEPEDDLDELWPRLETEMVLDGRPINLPAFGSLDFPDGRAIRIWNVSLRNLTTGEHTLACHWKMDGDEGGSTWHLMVKGQDTG